MKLYPRKCPGCTFKAGGPISLNKHYEKKPSCLKASKERAKAMGLARQKRRRKEIKEGKRQVVKRDIVFAAMPTVPAGKARPTRSRKTLQYCVQCGGQRGLRWKFCGYCGSQFKEE